MSLNNLFPGYLGFLTEDIEDLWNNAVIFVDANVILNFYAYSDGVMSEFKGVMGNPFFSDRFYITYQAALEYSRNRVKRINHQKDAAQVVKSELSKNLSQFSDWLKKEYRFHSQINIDEIIEVINEFNTRVNSIIGSKVDADSMESGFSSVDEFIRLLIGDRVTSEPSPARLAEIFQMGKTRYEKQVPPGFEDRKKAEEARTYGDLVIWLEMISFAKLEGINKVIFITDDAKEDWWWIEKGRKIGPHYLLVQEMLENGIKYYQYSSEKFIKYASEKIGRVASETALTEIREVVRKGQQRVEGIVEDKRGHIFAVSTALNEIKEELSSGAISKDQYNLQSLGLIGDFIKERVKLGKRVGGELLDELYNFLDNDIEGEIYSYVIDNNFIISDFVERIEDELSSERLKIRQNLLERLRKHRARLESDNKLN